jgi:hypothetical protein
MIGARYMHVRCHHVLIASVAPPAAIAHTACVLQASYAVRRRQHGTLSYGYQVSNQVGLRQMSDKLQTAPPWQAL